MSILSICVAGDLRRECTGCEKADDHYERCGGPKMGLGEHRPYARVLVTCLMPIGSLIYDANRTLVPTERWRLVARNWRNRCATPLSSRKIGRRSKVAQSRDGDLAGRAPVFGRILRPGFRTRGIDSIDSR